MVYFLMIVSPQGLPLYSSMRLKKRHNYCPISVISTIGKVFGRIIYYQLFTNLSDHNSLSNHQSEFHVLRSTVTALLKTCNIDMGNVNAVVFLDLKKLSV